MIHFQRGLGIKESLGIGEFTKINKSLREFFDKLIAGQLSSGTWSTSTTYEVEPKEMKFKHTTDSGGGNSHKFYVHMVLNDFSNYGPLKDKIKNYKWQMQGYVGDGFHLIAQNFYIGRKFFTKAGIEHKPNSILIEIIYSKKD